MYIDVFMWNNVFFILYFTKLMFDLNCHKYKFYPDKNLYFGIDYCYNMVFSKPKSLFYMTIKFLLIKNFTYQRKYF